MQDFHNNSFLIIISGILFTSALLVFPTASAQETMVPDWMKNTAKWWAEGIVSTSEYVTTIEFLINENIIQVPGFATADSSLSLVQMNPNESLIELTVDSQSTVPALSVINEDGYNLFKVDSDGIVQIGSNTLVLDPLGNTISAGGNPLVIQAQPIQGDLLQFQDSTGLPGITGSGNVLLSVDANGVISAEHLQTSLCNQGELLYFNTTDANNRNWECTTGVTFFTGPPATVNLPIIVSPTISFLQFTDGSLQSQINTNTASIAAMTGNIAANTASIGTNTANINTNTASIGTNTANINTNTASIGTNTANIGALQSQIAILQSQVNTLQSQVTTLTNNPTLPNFYYVEHRTNHPPSYDVNFRLEAPCDAGDTIISGGTQANSPDVIINKDYPRSYNGDSWIGGFYHTGGPHAVTTTALCADTAAPFRP